MHLAGLVGTSVPLPTQSMGAWLFTTATWATIAESDQLEEHAFKHRVVQRSAQSPTPLVTGLRREEVGGIVIGVVVGVILLVLLFWYCRRRRQPWPSDTESDCSVPAPIPPALTLPRAPKSIAIATPKPVVSYGNSSPPAGTEKPAYTPRVQAETVREPAIIPTLADNAYDRASILVAKESKGRRYVESHTSADKPRAVAWARPLALGLPPEGINTLQDRRARP